MQKIIENGTISVPVPMHSEIRVGTLMSVTVSPDWTGRSMNQIKSYDRSGIILWSNRKLSRRSEPRYLFARRVDRGNGAGSNQKQIY